MLTRQHYLLILILFGYRAMAQVALPRDPQEEILPSQEIVVKYKVRSVTLKTNLYFPYEKKAMGIKQRPLIKIVYDTAGRVIGKIQYNEFTTDTAELIQSFEQTVYDDKGNPVKSIYRTGSHRHENIYDTTGRLVEVHSYTGDKLWGMINYSFDEKGNITRKRGRQLRSGAEWIEDYAYDEAGKMVSKGYGDGLAIEIYKYDTCARLVETLDNLIKPVTRWSYMYNKKGWLAEVFYYEYGPAVRKKLYYNKQGLIKKQQKHYQDGTGKDIEGEIRYYEYEFYP
jgi:YD repeat-containing protein